MDVDFSVLSFCQLIELKRDAENEIERRKRENQISLLNEFKNTFLDVTDFIDVKFSTCEDDFWVSFSDLSFYDKETHKEITI